MPRLLPPDAGRALHLPSTGGRLRAALCTAWIAATGCTPAETPPAPEPEAPAQVDRESWDVRLQLFGARSSILVEAPYVADLVAAQITRADSGVRVTLTDSAGDASTHLASTRLVVDHRADVVSFAGQVSAVGRDGRVRARADTLAWDRAADRLECADGATLVIPDGRVTARHLSGTTDLATWTARRVTATFGDTAGGDAVAIAGRAADIEVALATVSARFDTVTGAWRGRTLRALQGRYDGATRAVHLSGAVAVEDSSRDPVRRVRADRIDLDLDRATFAAHGAVSADGEARLEADSLTEDEAGGWIVGGGPARIDVDGRTLAGRRVHLSSAADTVLAAGAASAAEGQRRIRADSLALLSGADAVEAYGGVAVTADDIEGDLRARRLRSTAAGARLELWGEAQLTRADSGGGALVLCADSIAVDREAGRLTGMGAFRLLSPPHIQLRAERGTYHTAGDTAGLSGQVEFLHGAEGGATSQLSADSCRVELAGGAPTRAIWPSALAGRLEDAEQVSWLRASSGQADLAGGRLLRLRLEGEVEVTHRGRTGERASRFTSQAMELEFDEDGILRHVRAHGQALARSHLPEPAEEGRGPSSNRVAGERLEVDLDGGRVVAVRVLDAVEGRFRPGESQEEPR